MNRFANISCGKICIEKIGGWILVEARFERHEGHDRACLQGQYLTCDNGDFEIFLPVLPNGRVHELIYLPDDVSDLVLRLPGSGQAGKSTANIRRVGWFERTWRMANRVIGAFQQLSGEQRAEVGLSLWKVVLDLPGAYRIATQFRWCSTYLQWIEQADRLDDEDVLRIRQHVAHFSNPQHFHLLLVADDAGQEALQMTLDSLRGQLYQNFTCVVLDMIGMGAHTFDSDVVLKEVGLESRFVSQQHVVAWLDQFNVLLAGNQAGVWVMLLRAGDVLAAHALYWFACEAQARPEAVVLYSDDDALDAEGQRCQPRFKPDWSLAHLRSTHFVGDAAVLRGSEVAAAGGVNPDSCRYGNYDLLLRVVDVVGDAGVGTVAHIPAVLLHRGCAPLPGSDGTTSHSTKPAGGQVAGYLPRGEREFSHGDCWGEPQWCMRALQAHLARNGVAAEVSETLAGCWRVRYRLAETPPLVSIIVPTRDALELIRQSVESLLAKTTYPRFEILVVDNQSADPEALAYLAEIDGRNAVRVLRYDRQFNYSAINNFAAREAKGDVLCLLNNDTEVISPDWLDEMVGHLLQPKVGSVGAKLYFPDGRVQHAGDTVGPGGCANHLHSFIERDDPGYCNQAVVAQELSAVTAACLITWRDLYLRLGGLDEKYLKVAFNDVDFCLRVRQAGHRVVWTPHAELYHHESVSRGKDTSWRRQVRAEREVAVMRRRWKQVMKNDPFYNPNFSYARTDFALSYMPGVKKPWLA